MTPALGPLARLELVRYARHPLFIAGVVVNVAVMLGPIDPSTSVALQRAAGATPVPERTRTLALLAACAVPFTAGLLWWIWAVATLDGNPPPANGYPFDRPGGWADAVMFGQGPMACLGGPVLGVVLGRWTRGRGTPALTAVGIVALCIVMQPLLPALRRIRVLSPWTHFGGPFGVPGDPDRMLVFSGSPGWWVAYLACLCGLGALAALLHDRERGRRPALRASAALGALAVACVLLAMWTGTPHTLVNPLPSGS